MRFSVIFCCTCLLAATLTINVNAQSIENQQLKLKKVDSQNNELAFTVLDAVELIRFLMTKDDIIKDCTSDFSEGTLKVVGHEDDDLGGLLLDENFNDELLVMGYRIYSEEDAVVEPYPLVSIATEPEDCDNCGSADVSKETIQSVLDNANYEGELLLDFSDTSSLGGGDDDPFNSMGMDSQFMSSGSSGNTINMDSLSNIINNAVPLELESIDNLVDESDKE